MSALPGAWVIREGRWTHDDGAEGLVWVDRQRSIRRDGVIYPAPRLRTYRGHEAETARLKWALSLFRLPDYDCLRSSPRPPQS